MSGLRIVHVSPTPLVGAPGKIAWAQSQKGHRSICVVLADYPKGGPLEGKFLDKSLKLDPFTRGYIEEEIRGADIVHVHNFLADATSDWLLKLNQSATYVYQAHSPLREGPLYVNRVPDPPEAINFALKLIVGQYAGRMFPDFIPVPNIIDASPSVKPRRRQDKLRVMFSPSHSRGGRWNAKYSARCEEVQSALQKLDRIELVRPDAPVSPTVLMELRRGCHLSIDEIVTGAFHQISLEALCAGNVAVNRADYFSKATYSTFCQGEQPPFHYADEGCIGDVLLGLAENWEETARLQQASFDFFQKYCAPQKLVEVFDEAYHRIQ